MPETFRRYQEWEVALRARDKSGEHARSGDIIDVREPIGILGTKERNEYLWIMLSGEDDSIMQSLVAYNTEPTFELSARKGIDLPALDASPKLFDKRRFCIPLARLNQVSPFDMTRVLDPADPYQPFMPVDEDNGRVLDGARRRSLDMFGLVFDKATGKYL